MKLKEKRMARKEKDTVFFETVFFTFHPLHQNTIFTILFLFSKLIYHISSISSILYSFSNHSYSVSKTNQTQKIMSSKLNYLQSKYSSKDIHINNNTDDDHYQQDQDVITVKSKSYKSKKKESKKKKKHIKNNDVQLSSLKNGIIIQDDYFDMDMDDTSNNYHNMNDNDCDDNDYENAPVIVNTANKVSHDDDHENDSVNSNNNTRSHNEERRRKKRRKRYDSDDNEEENTNNIKTTTRKSRHDSDDDDDDSENNNDTPHTNTSNSTKKKKKQYMSSGHHAGLQSSNEFQKNEYQIQQLKKQQNPHNIQGETIYRNSQNYKNDNDTKSTTSNNDKDTKNLINMGKTQRQNLTSQIMTQNIISQSTFARSQSDVDQYTKNKLRQNDPMLSFQTKSNNNNSKKVYKGPQPKPNRYNIQPGYRWDGIDRSNGFEDDVLKCIYEHGYKSENRYKWSCADM